MTEPTSGQLKEAKVRGAEEFFAILFLYMADHQKHGTVNQDQVEDDACKQYNEDQVAPVQILQNPGANYQEDEHTHGNQEEESTDRETEHDDQYDTEGQFDDEDY